VGLLVFFACLAGLTGWRLAQTSNRAFQFAFLVVGASLLFGAGANGFFDVLYCLAGFDGLVELTKSRHANALALFAIAGSLHFRAAVLLPAAGVALWRGLSGLERRRTLFVLGVAAVVLAPVAYAALVLDTHAFAVVNPLRVKLARTLAFAAVTAIASAFALLRKRPIAGLTLLCAGLLMYADPLHCWWHALVLLFPPMVAAAEDAWSGEAHPVAAWLWLWTVLAALATYRDPWPPFWEWIRWALLRVGA
jgi:hypothetical protein